MNSTWQTYRDQGKELFRQKDYAAALAKFTSALDCNVASPFDRQRLLSNVVACRLKLQQPPELAIADAKACVAINNQWAPAHVRLASAYLLNQQSNDACNSLQTAIQLDPTHAIARQMLLSELRRRNGSNPSPVNPDYTEPDEYYDDTHNHTPWLERCQFHVQSMRQWYRTLHGDVRTVLHIVLGLILLYVLFGGRFGLDTMLWNNKAPQQKLQGDYSNNVYNTYRQQQQRRDSESYYSRRSSNNRNSNYGSYNNNNNNQYDDATYYGSGGGYGASSYNYGGSNSLGSSEWLYIPVLLGGFYVAYQMGISPWQVLMLMNVVGGRRRYMGGGGMRYRRRRGW